MAIKRSAVIITALALTAAAFPPAASGVAGKTFAAEVGFSFGFQTADLLLAGACAVCPFGIFLTYPIAAAYPAAAAFGADVGARTAGDPAPNRLDAFGYATIAAYAESALFVGTVLVLKRTHRDVRDVYMNDIYLGILLFDFVSKPFLVSCVYNKARKEPPTRKESRISLAPYVCAADSTDGKKTPLYGVTLSF
jgi:hypothetical protein